MTTETADTEKALADDATTDPAETEIVAENEGDAAAVGDVTKSEGEGDGVGAEKPASEDDKAVTPAPFDWKVIAGDNAALLKSLEPYTGGVSDLLKEIGDSKAKLDNWRDQIAGDNKKLRKELEKSASQSDFGKRFNNLLSRVGDTNLVRKPTEKSSPEEIAAWRAARGVPAKVEDYKINLPEGAKALDDLGKAAVEQFLTDAFAAEMDQRGIDAAVAGMQRYIMIGEAEREKQVEAHRKENEDTLRGKWGTDYRRNEDYANRAMEEYFPDLGAAFLDQRLENGARLGDFAPFLEGMARLGAETGIGGTPFIDGEWGRGETPDDEVSRLMALRHSKNPAEQAKYASEQVQKRLLYLMGKVA